MDDDVDMKSKVGFGMFLFLFSSVWWVAQFYFYTF